MIDIDAKIRALLVSKPAITAIFGNRVYAARSLPVGYMPDQGPALLFNVRGGGQEYSSQAYAPSVQIRVYAATEGAARQASRAVYDAINDVQARGFAYIRMESGTLPTLLDEPVTNWPYVLSYYTFNTLNL